MHHEYVGGATYNGTTPRKTEKKNTRGETVLRGGGGGVEAVSGSVGGWVWCGGGSGTAPHNNIK